jgi:hypothetical protein
MKAIYYSISKFLDFFCDFIEFITFKKVVLSWDRDFRKKFLKYIL